MLYDHFPFGEWDEVSSKKEGITYCGKELRVVDKDGERVIELAQKGFVEGRLDLIPISKERAEMVEEAATEEERTDFRSVLGSLQWLATQTRADISYHVNQLQKRVNKLQVRDLLVANKVVRLVKKHDLSVTFKNLGCDVAVVSWHDASLYNSLGVEIDENDDDLVQSFGDRKLLYSQKGVVAGFVKRTDVDRTEPVACNVACWRSKTNKRIVESSFAAETHGALAGHGTGSHLRALYVELCHGSWTVMAGEDLQWNQFTPLIMCTDCKSVYDCIKKDGHSMGDKGNALNVAVLRQLCSSEKSPSGQKAHLLWLPTRHQIADGLTKSGRHGEMQSIFNEGLVTFHGLSTRHLQKAKRGFPQCES